MNVYRIYLTEPDEHIRRPPVEAECESDNAAVAIARSQQHQHQHTVEVWHGNRRVAVLKPVRSTT